MPTTDQPPSSRSADVPPPPPPDPPRPPEARPDRMLADARSAPPMNSLRADQATYRSAPERPVVPVGSPDGSLRPTDSFRTQVLEPQQERKAALSDSRFEATRRQELAAAGQQPDHSSAGDERRAESIPEASAVDPPTPGSDGSAVSTAGVGSVRDQVQPEESIRVSEVPGTKDQVPPHRSDSDATRPGSERGTDNDDGHGDGSRGGAEPGDDSPSGGGPPGGPPGDGGSSGSSSLEEAVQRPEDGKRYPCVSAYPTFVQPSGEMAGVLTADPTRASQKDHDGPSVGATIREKRVTGEPFTSDELDLVQALERAEPDPFTLFGGRQVSEQQVDRWVAAWRGLGPAEDLTETMDAHSLTENPDAAVVYATGRRSQDFGSMPQDGDVLPSTDGLVPGHEVLVHRSTPIAEVDREMRRETDPVRLESLGRLREVWVRHPDEHPDLYHDDGTLMAMPFTDLGRADFLEERVGTGEVVQIGLIDARNPDDVKRFGDTGVFERADGVVVPGVWPVWARVEEIAARRALG